jgi:hypothetical protein
MAYMESLLGMITNSNKELLRPCQELFRFSLLFLTASIPGGTQVAKNR